MRNITVNLSFLKDGELGIEVLLHIVFYFSLSGELLVHELAAGKSKDLQSLTRKLLIHFNHLLVVVSSEATFACNIDNHEDLFAFELAKMNKIAINVLGLEIKEALRSLTFYGCTTLFEDEFAGQSSHEVSANKNIMGRYWVLIMS